MDEEIELRECVNINTIRFGIGELENIGTKNVQDQLIKIERYFQCFSTEQENIASKLKEYKKMSVLSISKGSEVSRSQINHPNNVNSLKKYIDERIKEIEKIDILGSRKFERTIKNNQLINNQLDNLRQNVVDNYELDLQILDLENKQKSIINQNISYIEKIGSLEKEVQRLQRVLNKIEGNKVVPLNSKGKR